MTSIRSTFVGNLSVLAAVGFVLFANATSALAEAPPVFYDADRTAFNNEKKIQEYSGNVLVMAAGVILTADSVSVDGAAKRIQANGKVVIMAQSQVFSGESMTYYVETGDFVLENATLVADDLDSATKVKNQILGFTENEIAFEIARKERLAENAREKSALIAEVKARGEQVDDIAVQRLAVLIEQEKLIKQQPSPSFTRTSEKRRQALKRRREVWERSRADAIGLPRVKSPGYFKLVGSSIERSNGNDYLVQSALFTPCKCDDEAPAWAFRADRAFLQEGGYIDLSHAVLEIKGIPLLYLPYLKLPVKDQRQSGFLLPTISHDRLSGNSISQPLYLAFSEASDATFYTDFYENRGTKLGLELRFEHRQYSGWEMRFDAMRDRLWLEQNRLHSELYSYYSEGLQTAYANRNSTDPAAQLANLSPREKLRQQVSSPDYWKRKDGLREGKCLDDDTSVEQCQDEIEANLATPGTAWRGGLKWRGQSFLAPRLSVVSHGDALSDHRFPEELNIDRGSDFLSLATARYFSLAKAQAHLDHPEFYLGLGSRYADPVLLPERFAGQQLPLRVKLQTRWFRLLPGSWDRLPIYATVGAESLAITQFESNVAQTDLGNGTWRRVLLETSTPIFTETIVSVSHFSQLEGRYIASDSLQGEQSSVRSWRTGLSFRLPIDGKGRVPFFDAANPEFVHHLMDVELRGSLRPVVVNSGPYGRGDTEAHSQSYFTGDGFDFGGADSTDVLQEDVLLEHQRLTIATNHRWRLFTLQKKEKSGEANPNETSEAQARRELMNALAGQAIFANLTPQDLLQDKDDRTTNYGIDPVSFKAEMTHDFLLVDKRKQDAKLFGETKTKNDDLLAQIASEKESSAPDRETRIEVLESQLRSLPDLAEPWIGPIASLNLNLLGFSYSLGGTYNLYNQLFTQLGLSLATPAFWGNSASFGYTIEKDLVQQGIGFQLTQTKVRSATLQSRVWEPLMLLARVARRDVDNSEYSYRDNIETGIGVEYRSPADCWGLRFRREKLYRHEEREASYLLELLVVFLGREERSLPNMSSGLLRNTAGTQQ